MTSHIYSVGQLVSFDGRGRTYLKPAGVFAITKLLPPLGEELQYRIKNEREAHDRVATEQELQVAGSEKSIDTAGPRMSFVDVSAAHDFAGLG